MIWIRILIVVTLFLSFYIFLQLIKWWCKNHAVTLSRQRLCRCSLLRIVIVWYDFFIFVILFKANLLILAFFIILIITAIKLFHLFFIN